VEEALLEWRQALARAPEHDEARRLVTFLEERLRGIEGALRELSALAPEHYWGHEGTMPETTEDTHNRLSQAERDADDYEQWSANRGLTPVSPIPALLAPSSNPALLRKVLPGQSTLLPLQGKTGRHPSPRPQARAQVRDEDRQSTRRLRESAAAEAEKLGAQRSRGPRVLAQAKETMLRWGSPLENNGHPPFPPSASPAPLPPADTLGAIPTDEEIAALAHTGGTPPYGLKVSPPPAPRLPTPGTNASAVRRAATDCRQRLAAGDVEGAYSASERAIAAAMEDQQAEATLEAQRPVFERAYEQVIGGRERVPVMARDLKKIPAGEFDHRVGFLVSCIDGQLDVDALMEISGMSSLETLRALAVLFRRGLVRFADGR
jgi:hypothetical protein